MSRKLGLTSVLGFITGIFFLAAFSPSAAFASIGAPTNVQAVAGDGYVTVTFTPAVATAGETISGYTAYTGGTDVYGVTYYFSQTGPAPSIVVKVTNGNAYKFKVYASGVAGNGPDSAFSNSVVPAAGAGGGGKVVTPPATNPTSLLAPTSVSAVAGPADGSATVSFTDPNPFSVSVYTVTALGPLPTASVIASGPTSPVVFPVGSLVDGQPYTFTVAVQTSSGTSPNSAPSAPVTPVAPAGAGSGGGTNTNGNGGTNGTNTPSSTSTGNSLNIKINYVNPLTSATIDVLLANIVNAAVLLLSPIVVIMIIWTGFLFIKAQGNAEALSSAKKALLYTLIGAAIVLIAKGFSLAIKGFFSQF